MLASYHRARAPFDEDSLDTLTRRPSTVHRLLIRGYGATTSPAHLVIDAPPPRQTTGLVESATRTSRRKGRDWLGGLSCLSCAHSPIIAPYTSGSLFKGRQKSKYCGQACNHQKLNGRCIQDVAPLSSFRKVSKARCQCIIVIISPCPPWSSTTCVQECPTVFTC